MSWLNWLGRRQERDQAYARLNAMRQTYGEQGERVINLSARTDLARKSAGSTQRAFDFVERTFAQATEIYAKAGEYLSRIEANLEKGVVAYFPEAENALKELTPSLDELERQLSQWEAQWHEVPRQIDEVAEELARVRHTVEMAAAAAGAPLPPIEKLLSAEAFLERIRRTLSEGNPMEAGHMVADLRISLAKLREETNLYQSGMGAITGAEQDLARTRERVEAAGSPPEAARALAEAEALLTRLRPSLIAGKIEPFQKDLLDLQRRLSEARKALHP